MGDRPILTLKKKAPVAPAPAVESKPLSPQQVEKAARAAAAEIEHREKAAAIAVARPVFEAYFHSLPVVQENKPLAVKILYVFLAWMREQPVAAGFTGAMLRRTVEPIIAEHVLQPVYLTAVLNESHRRNIDGSLADPIEDGHKSGASKKLEKMERKAIKRIEGMNTMEA